MKGIFRGTNQTCNDLSQRITKFRELCRNLVLEHQLVTSKQIQESLTKHKCCRNCTHQCTECNKIPTCQQKAKCSRTPCQYCGKLPRNCKKEEITTAINVLKRTDDEPIANKDKRIAGKLAKERVMVKKTDRNFELEQLSGAFVTYCLFLCENKIITKLDLDDYFMEQRMIFRLPIETLRFVYPAKTESKNVQTTSPNAAAMQINDYDNCNKVAVVKKGI